MLDRTEVAALIGVQPRTISQMVQSGRLPAYKFNERLTRFRRDDIVKWIENAKFQAV